MLGFSANVAFSAGIYFLLFLPKAFKEGVAKYPVVFRCPVQIPDSLVEQFLPDHARLERLFAHAFDHGSECFLRETVHQLRPAGVDIDHTGRDADRGIARFAQ